MSIKLAILFENHVHQTQKNNEKKTQKIQTKNNITPSGMRKKVLVIGRGLI